MEGALRSDWSGTISCAFPSELYTILYELYISGERGIKILEFTGFSGDFYVVNLTHEVYPNGIVGTFEIRSAPLH